MTAAEKLRKIVQDARGDSLERAEAAWRCNQGGAHIEIYRKVFDECRRERAEWQRASDLLDQLFRDTGAAAGGDAGE